MKTVTFTESQLDSIKRDIVKPITSFQKLSECAYIGERKKNRYMYKYMDIETAILCLKSNSIQFIEPTEWEDKYERRFYTADYSLITTNKSYTPKLYACCFTFSKASEAAWKTYSYNKSGLASRCVQFRINKAKFRKILHEYAKKNKCKVYEGPIDYSYTDSTINQLHLPTLKIHSLIFNKDFKLNNYLSLLLIKRQAFNYENEYRFFIIPQIENNDKAIYPTINWSDIIEGINVDKQCSDIEIEILNHYCKEYKVTVTPEKFNLYENPDSQIKIEL